MKSIMRFFSIAALAAAVATMVGCTKEETNNTDGQTCSTVVKLPEGGSKAITGDGHKTFVVGDRIRMYEQLPSGDWQYSGKSLALTSADISNDGKAARFTFLRTDVDNMRAGETWRFVYPGDYIDEVNQPGDGSGIHLQTGNLETLGSTYDYAKYDFVCTANGELPSTIRLANQYAILKLKILNSVGTDITSIITKLDIANSNIPYNSITNSSNIQVSRGEVPGPIYIAMYPTSDNIEFSTSNENYNHGGYYFTRTKTVTGKTLQAGHLYPVELTMPSTNVTLYSEDITAIGQYGWGSMGGIYVMAEGGATWTGTDGGNGPTVISINGEGDVRFDSDYGKISRIIMTGFTKGGGDLPSGWTESDGTISWSGTPAETVYMAYGTATLTAEDGAQIVFTVE